MKKLLFVLLLVVSVQAFGQPGFTPINQRYKWLAGTFSSTLAMPSDTFAVSGAYVSYPWIAAKGDNMYRWSQTQNKWVQMADGGIAWGAITGDPADQTDLQLLLDAKQDLLTTGSADEFYAGDLTLKVFEDEVTNITEPIYLHLDDVRDSIIEVGDDRYKRKYLIDLPLQEYTLGGDTIILRVRYWDHLYSARDLMGYNLPTLPPENGAYPSYDEASGEFVWAYPESSPISFSSPGSASFASYRDDDMVKVLKRMYEMIVKQGKEIEKLKKSK